MNRCTRLAPSPTGALHLGNARTFLINWALARQGGWRIVLRVDDLDGPRVKQDAAAQAVEDLKWLGLDWDEGPVLQTAHRRRYREALAELAAGGWIYPCRCTRSEIEAASLSAPQAGEHELRYGGACRPRTEAERRRRDELAQGDLWLQPAEFAWRLETPDADIEIRDEFAGTSVRNVQRQVGDFLVATKSGWPSYQLAVVLDDQIQQVTDVVRGDDLLDSTPRQGLLQQRLGLPAPRYWHVPIVVGPDGRRLAKRHGDSRLRHYRERGASPQRVLALLARWCGGPAREACTLDEFLREFELARVPRERIVMTPRDDAWLLAG